MDGEEPLEKGMTTHSSILAWEIPWREEPGRLQFRGSQRIDMTEQARNTDLRLLKSCLVIVTLYISQSQQSHWPINVFAYLSHLINSEIWGGCGLKVRTVSHLFLCSQVLEKFLSRDTSNG